MANRFSNPFPQFFNSTPQVLSGAKLFFYITNSATKLNTFQDSGLTVPNLNPIILNANGFSPTNIFLQNQAYRVVLAPSTDSDPPTSPIWVADPVYSSDFSTVAMVDSFPGNPNGFVAGSAGDPASMIWDSTDKVLYICTTTGDQFTAVWTPINTTQTVNVPFPQGRLTLTSLTPVINADVIAATSVFYTPYTGNVCPIYNGTQFAAQAFTEQTLSLVGAHTANTIFDVFAFMNGTTFTVVTGPAWTASGAGAGARGSGGGTTQLTMLNGILVNAVQITGRNGANTFTIPANTATYLGSIFIDGTNGQITAHVSFGQSRKNGVWNAYNRRPIRLQAGDGTASWTYTSPLNTWRPSNGAAANSMQPFTGLAEETINLSFSQRVAFGVNSGGGTAELRIGMGINSTTAPTGQVAEKAISIGGSGGPNITHDMTIGSRATILPGLGINTVTSLENTIVNGNTGNNTFNGTSTYMLLEANYMG